MASMEAKLAASTEFSHSVVGGTATATLAAAASVKNYVTMAIISSSGAVPAAGEVTLVYVKDGTTFTIVLEIPANAFAPIILNFGSHPVEGDLNTAITLAVPALSGGTQGATLIGYKRPA